MQTPKIASMPCVILTGGQSKRMQIGNKQSDKALLAFGRHTSLLDYQFDKMSAWFEKVYISSKRPYKLQAPYLLDNAPASTPLTGITTCLNLLPDNAVFFIPVDMPFVSLQSILALCDQSKKGCVIYPKSTRTFYLCSVWQKGALETLKKAQVEQQYAVYTLLEQLDSHPIHVKDSLEFSNLNTYADYQNALKYLRDIHD